MPNMLENYGLDFLAEDEETMMGFVGYLVQNGKAFHSYSGAPYLYTPMGAVEFWVRTQKNEEGNLEIAGVDSHCGGKCIWKMASTDFKLSESNTEPMRKLMIFNRYEDGSGMLPIEVINPDVLPGPMDGDPVVMQVVALPVQIGYYADEDEYAASMPDDENGKKWMVANGSLFPSGFMYNHAPDRPEEEKDYSLDSHILFTATVKRLIYGTFEMGDHEENTFIRCIVDTQFGELEFNHTVDQVPEELRKNMRVGAVVSGICIISGDVALYEYENGIVKDLEHNLRALRYSFVHGEAERLYSILAENAVYYTETSGKTFEGADAIVEKLNYVHENHEGKYFAHMATITEVDPEAGLKYAVGTRCVVLAADEENNYESIAFIQCNDEGLIVNVDISTDGRYRFKIDEKPVHKTPLDDIEIPDSVIEPIVMRARFHGLIDDDVTAESIITHLSDYTSLKFNVDQMLEALQKTPQPDIEVALENLFGYLFAKAIEQEVNEAAFDPSHKTRLTASYSPDDAFAGELRSTFDEHKHIELEKKMKLGRQFYKDYKAYTVMKDLSEDDFFDTITQALIAVQRIGQINSKTMES